ncbi:MAG: DNA-directed RNA polymerase subunit beta, partial [Phycisphaerales bacterium]|nr:DNA-directed RNA polymerase subunit beta [Phycisphaerales bacterium]
MAATKVRQIERVRNVRSFAKRGDATKVPDLWQVQEIAYERFLQTQKNPDERDAGSGLEALLQEIFPIESYDETMSLEYVSYSLEQPRYTSDECRELRLTYGHPFRLRLRLKRETHGDLPEEDIYLGEFPVLIGGGEYIVNGAERVIVSQLHRSPGVDFSIVSSESDRPLHSARIIPERGSWIELEVTKKDVLAMRIDQSTKLTATTFLRCLDESVASTDAIIGLFYEVSEIKAKDIHPEDWAAASIIDTETGEELVHVGCQVGEEGAEAIKASALKTIRVVQNPSDSLILNTIAEEKLEQFDEVPNVTSDYDRAMLKVYSRLRPGNPPQVEKAKQLFHEKFFDGNRYRLGKVGRFRINRKFDMDIAPDQLFLLGLDFLKVVQYMLDLRSNRLDPETQRPVAHIDDIDHLGNRRLRTLDELAVEEVRKGLLKLRRTVQERMSVKDPEEVAKIA